MNMAENFKPFQSEPALNKKHLTGNQGYVYIAEIVQSGHIKIGRSKTPTKRIKHFSTIMPVDIQIVSWFYADDCVQAEATLHKNLDLYRVTGEWFQVTKGIYNQLKRAFCYIDGRFCTVDEIELTCCEVAVRESRKQGIERGEIALLYDHLPY
jgi:hypothetical protein